MGNCFKNKNQVEENVDLQNEIELKNEEKEVVYSIEEFKMDGGGFNQEMNKVADRMKIGKDTGVRLEMEKAK
jgi:hypothetical protein